MPKGHQKIPQATWIYIAILTLVVIIFWSLFWKKEFKLVQVESEGKSIEEIFNELVASLKGGGVAVNQLAQKYKEQNELQLPPELVGQTLARIEQLSLQKRTASWQSWSGEQLSFKIPADWLLTQKDQQFIISSYDATLPLNPTAWATIKINFLENPDNLDYQQWWSSNYSEQFSGNKVTESEAIVGGLTGGRYEIEANLEVNGFKYYFLSHLQQMIEIVVEYYGENEIVNQNIADVLSTITFF